MAQEMLENEALLNLVMCVSDGDEPIYNSEVWINQVSNEEK